MKKIKTLTFLIFVALIYPAGAFGSANQEKSEKALIIVWDVNNIKSIGGHKTTVLGSPKVIETDKGKAVEFDGVKDGLIVNALPLAAAEKFTLEIIFRPDANGLKEQRFLHLQEDGSDSRTLIETRLPGGNLWYLDTYIQTEKGKRAMLEPKNTHQLSRWYSASLVYDGQEMRHYINGVQEMSGKLEFTPLKEGKTSIGVRMNEVYWFKGAIRQVRFTKKALEQAELLKP
jgi:hypothetical protein